MIWAFQAKIGVNPIHIAAITDIDPEKLTRRLLMAGFGKFRRDVDPLDRLLWAGRAMSLCQDGHTACRTAA